MEITILLRSKAYSNSIIKTLRYNTRHRRKGITSLFIFFCFFPYIQIIPSGTDSQPYALFFGVIILLITHPSKMIQELFYLFLIMGWSILLLFFIDSTSILSAPYLTMFPCSLLLQLPISFFASMVVLNPMFVELYTHPRRCLF